jgi:hypothetical protein
MDGFTLSQNANGKLYHFLWDFCSKQHALAPMLLANDRAKVGETLA